jgi:plastocyanin
VGDQVLVSYYQGTLAQIVKGGTKVSDPAAAGFAYGNSPGMKPAGGAGLSATVTVKIQDINLPTNTVAFTKSDGTTHIVQVKSPEMQKYLREVKPGDTVQVTFTDSVAVAVIPAS